MKHILMSTVALAMMVAPATADLKKLVTSGYWSTYYSPANTGGVPMCMMQASWGNPNSVMGRAYFKWEPSGFYIHIMKTDWNFPANVDVPLKVEFDYKEYKAPGRTLRSTQGNLSMIEIGIDPKIYGEVMVQFMEANAMKITFLSGNEPPWIANMNGSRIAGQHFIQCIKWIKENHRPPSSPVGPQATSPVGPPATSPIPTGPGKRKDDGSI